MNKVCLINCPCLNQFINDLADGFKAGEYYISHRDNSITFSNKYFYAFLEFLDVFDENAEYDAIVFFGKPQVTPTLMDSLYTVVVLDPAAEIGQYDTDDLLYEYVLTAEELAEHFAYTAWKNVIQTCNLYDPGVESIEKTAENDMATKIHALIMAIRNNEIRQEAEYLELYMKTQSDEDLDSFYNAFTIIERLSQLLKSAEDDDRKLAAAAIALLLGQECCD